MLKILSHRNWGILRYNSIFQNLIALFYIASTRHLLTLTFIGLSLLFFIFSTLMTGYGYLVNDLADIDIDRLHGKKNAFATTGVRKAWTILLIILLLGLVFSLPFIKNVWFDIIWLVWILTATFYSLRPLRLKEKGFIGLVATVLAQQTLPTVLLFTAFDCPMNIGTAILIIFSTTRGFSSDLGHQVRDWAQDSRTKTTTFVVKIGLQRAKTIYMALLEAERLVLGAVVILLSVDLPKLRLLQDDWNILLALPMFLIYVVLLVKTMGGTWAAWKTGVLEENDPYNEIQQTQHKNFYQLIHHTFPTVLLPLYLACLLTINYLPFSVYILVIVVVFKLYRLDLWKRFIPFHLSH